MEAFSLMVIGVTMTLKLWSCSPSDYIHSSPSFLTRISLPAVPFPTLRPALQAWRFYLACSRSLGEEHRVDTIPTITSSADSIASSLLSTKLFIPQVRQVHDVLQRPRLIERLTTELSRKRTLKAVEQPAAQSAPDGLRRPCLWPVCGCVATSMNCGLPICGN